MLQNLLYRSFFGFISFGHKKGRLRMGEDWGSHHAKRCCGWQERPIVSSVWTFVYEHQCRSCLIFVLKRYSFHYQGRDRWYRLEMWSLDRDASIGGQTAHHGQRKNYSITHPSTLVQNYCSSSTPPPSTQPILSIHCHSQIHHDYRFAYFSPS